jgi:hypothetical protein
MHKERCHPRLGRLLLTGLAVAVLAARGAAAQESPGPASSFTFRTSPAMAADVSVVQPEPTPPERIRLVVAAAPDAPRPERGLLAPAAPAGVAQEAAGPVNNVFRGPPAPAAGDWLRVREPAPLPPVPAAMPPAPEVPRPEQGFHAPAVPAPVAQEMPGPVGNAFFRGPPAMTADNSPAAPEQLAQAPIGLVAASDPVAVRPETGLPAPLSVSLVADPIVPAPSDQPLSPPEQQAPGTDQQKLGTDQQKLGEAPPDTSHEFLREDSVLLKACEWQVDVGFDYTVFDHNYTNLGTTTSGGQPVIVALDSRLTRRLLETPVAIRYGVTDRLQAFVTVPFGWSNTQNSYTGFDQFTNQYGIGDITAGFSWLVHKSCGCSCDPDVIATFAFTAPTADVNPLQGILAPPSTTLGQGFWYGSWNLLFIHTIDPVIVFYGISGRQGVTRDFEGFDITPGDQYSYRCGVGFAVNERVVFSTSLTGSYIAEPRLDGQHIDGLAMEPISVRFATTVAQGCRRRFWDTFVEIGLTPDAPNSRVGMTFTY